MYLNVNEHLVVPFVELGRGEFHVGHLHFFFKIDYLSEHSYSHTGLIFFFARNLAFYLHFAFCWSNSNVPFIHPTIRTVSGDQM